MKKILINTMIILSVIFIAWVTLSYIEVMNQHNYESPEYSEYNCFTIIMEVLEK